jgi:hypothetical protein
MKFNNNLGNKNYYAPEIIANLENPDNINEVNMFKCDFYSLGLV